MLESWQSRLVALGVVGCLLAGSMVWAGTVRPAPELGAYPTPEWYVEDPDRYLGESVRANGVVVGTDPVELEVETGDGETATVLVRGLETPVDRGDRLAVFGTLEAPGAVAAVDALAFPDGRFVTMYVVSFVAGVWTLWRVLREWRIDPEGVGLAPRAEPIEFGSTVRDWSWGGGRGG